MTPEEEKAALLAELQASRDEAAKNKAAAEQAEAVSKTLTEELNRVNAEAKASTTKLTVKIGNKKGEIKHGCKHNSTTYTAKQISESKDKEFLQELVDAEVITIID